MRFRDRLVKKKKLTKERI